MITKSNLKSITGFVPFNESYVKVAKGKKGDKWNLMGSDGKLIGDTWFSAIEKNSDGSIVAKVKVGRKVTEATFINVAAFVRNAPVIKDVPVKCFGLVDTGSLNVRESTRNGIKMVATAKLYGIDVTIDADGNVYDMNGNKLRLLFNTVDTERLYKAVKAFNKKMHYDFTDEGRINSFEAIYKKNFSMWGFYWVTDELAYNTDSNSIDDEVKKWTDDIKVRLFEDKVTDSVLESLKSTLGLGVSKTTNGGYKYHEWNLNKNDLDKFINALAAV